MENQEKVWDKIAPEWDEYKQIPARSVLNFLKKCQGEVIDFGSGSGRNLIKLDGVNWTLLDFSKEMLKLAKERARKLGIEVTTIHSKMEDVPIDDATYDFALCVSALHCVEGEKNREKAVGELHRILKKGGKAYVGVWNKESKRFKKKRGKEHLIGWTDKGKRYYYLFTEKEVHNLFKKCGFKIISTYNSEMMINFVVIKK